MLNTKCLRERPLHDSIFDIRYSIFKVSSAGFTLLELMISIAIFGIMVVILMGVLRLGFRSVEAGGKKIDSLERVKASLNVINAQILSAIPLSHEVDGETRPYFKGDRTFLELATNYSIWEGEAGYAIVSYRVAEGDRGKWSLWASEGKIGQENRKEIKLLDQFDDLYFEYFYKEPTEETGRWVDQWTEDNPIPVPEKIRIHWSTGGKEIFLTIPIKTGQSLVVPGLKKKT